MGEFKDVVAIIDDEPFIRETASFILEMEGYEVITACNGEEGLELVRQERPKVVLLDVMMPRKNGYDVCREIKSDPALKDIFIIMLTAKGQKADQEKAQEVGADCYITKPFDDEVVLALISRVIRN